ncbi:MAG: penicillin-binding transpeptidase domain-containing protein [Nannocystaceae bacterium]
MNRPRESVLPLRMATDPRSVRRRAGLVGIVLLCCAVGLLYRAYVVAVEHHDAYAAQGNRQQLRNYRLAASRGEIVDRNYLALAVNDRVHQIVLNPRLIRGQGKQDDVMRALSDMFPDQDPAYFRDELSRDKAYRMLRMPVADEPARELVDKRLAGVSVQQTPQRVYPRQSLASHILGRVNSQGQGNLGVELGADRWLRGRETSSPAYYASHRGVGRKLLVDGHPDPGMSRGHSVVLTLDTALQAMAEEEVNTLVERWNPVGASIVILDPATGEVLAIANRPSFDPNHRIEAAAMTVNLAVQAAYEPGSTMKAITVAAALEQGTIRENQTFYCEEGRWQYTPRHVIRDTSRNEWLTVTDVLAVSSNICTTKIYETLDKQALHRWVRRFHFGERPPIQLPGATRGLLADWKKWSDIQGANVSFGQGMSASPLQVASAFAALANAGIYNAPTIVSKVIANDGEVVWQHEPTKERVVRAATANTVLEMLTSVVHTKQGTGKNARIDGYRVAGKTSTAQKANPAGGYHKDRYYASFVGAVPAHAPRLVILVSVDNPEGGHYGNQVAAPTFSRIGERALAYFGVPRVDGSRPTPLPPPLRADLGAVRTGPIPDLDVEPDLPGSRRVAFSPGIPDFSGMGLAQAMDAAEQAHVRLRALGSGLAVGQDTAAGAGAAGTTITVHFEPPQ